MMIASIEGKQYNHSKQTFKKITDKLNVALKLLNSDFKATFVGIEDLEAYFIHLEYEDISERKLRDIINESGLILYHLHIGTIDTL